MKYCRYCSYCILGDWYYCTCHDKVLKRVDKPTSCEQYVESELEDLREIVFMDRSEAIKNLKAEAIKEFAERLKANMSNIARMEYGGNIYFCVGYDLIDNLVKEMTEVASDVL